MVQRDKEFFTLKAELCKTFSDPKRLMIITELREGEKHVGELVRTLQISQAVVSRHLAILHERGMVTVRQEGVTHFYKLSDDRIGIVCDLIDEILRGKMIRDRDLANRLMP